MAALIALLAVLLTTTAISIALTFAPCYSSLRSEEYFPNETRIHIAVYFALLLSLGLCFLIRAKSKSVASFSRKQICKRRIPLLEAQITYGGIFITIWILFVVLVTTAIWLNINPWWMNHFSNFSDKSDLAVTATVTGIIGHHIDVILGLVIIPVPRHSAICVAFGFPASTLLWAHKALAYLLLLGTIAHGATYLAFIGYLFQEPAIEQSTISILYPYVDNSANPLGAYNNANFPTGIVSIVLIIIITITALAYFRRRHFEIFYYTHIILAVLLMIAACIHASTNFYCLLPGLFLWTYDLAWRFYGGTGLARAQIATIETAENSWVRISVVPQKSNKALASYPLSTYYLNLPSSSKIQCHPMSATTSQVGGETQFLFGTCSPESKKQQWTTAVGKLSSIGDNQTRIRLEGPYLPHIPDLNTKSHIMCIVGGTGLTGALSIADWWSRNTSKTQALTIIWSIRNIDMANLSEWTRLNAIASSNPLLQLELHITSKAGRLDLLSTIGTRTTESPVKNQSIWVYISGPEGLIKDGEDACLDLQKTLLRNRSPHTLQYYAPSWES